MEPDEQNSQEWINVSIDCDIDLLPEVCDLLESFGAQAVTIEKSEILDHRESAATVIGLFETKSYAAVTLREALQTLLPEKSVNSLSELRFSDRNWVRIAQEQHELVEILDRLLVIAPWHTMVTTDKPFIVINPGLAFGTGHHPTTRMCLEQLARIDVDNKTVIDFGCGSGVLACASLELGAARAWGVDSDPDCLTESTRNAEINRLENRYSAHDVADEILDTFKADVVLANIYADALVELAPKISNMVKVDGWLILSGILISQTPSVLKKYAENFTLETYTTDQWCMLAGKRKTQY